MRDERSFHGYMVEGLKVHRRLVGSLKERLLDAREAGRAFREAKFHTDSNEEWIECLKRFRIGQRTVQRYMSVFQKWPLIQTRLQKLDAIGGSIDAVLREVSRPASCLDEAKATPTKTETPIAVDRERWTQIKPGSTVASPNVTRTLAEEAQTLHDRVHSLEVQVAEMRAAMCACPRCRKHPLVRNDNVHA